MNAEYDAVIFPASSWLNGIADFGETAEALRVLKKPVVIIGLGANHPSDETEIKLPDGTVRFLKEAFDRAASVSVRGEMTQRVLKRYGFTYTRVTGCPSLFTDFASYDRVQRSPFRLEDSLLHSTRHDGGYREFLRHGGVNVDLFRFAFARNNPLLLQSEVEEIALLVGKVPDRPRDQTRRVRKIYGALAQRQVDSYLEERARVCFNVDDWSAYVRQFSFCFGTRLHATIMGLNSGVPSVLVHHDLRTRELAEFAAIPHLSARDAVISKKGIANAYETADIGGYYRRREELREGYLAFLKENGLTPDPTIAARRMPSVV